MAVCYQGCIRLCVVLCIATLDTALAEEVVVGTEGGAAVLLCTVSILGDLRWRAGKAGGDNILLIRTGGQVLKENTSWRDVISLVGSSNNLNISSLSRYRDDGRVFRCEGTAAGGGHQETTVRVLAPSAVEVTYNHRSDKLTCTAEGFPNVHTFGPWEHRLGGILIRTLGNVTLGTSVSYTLPGKMSYVDTRDYVCSATNGIKSSGSGLVYIAPLTPAVFQNHSQTVIVGLGKSERISVSFYARSSSGTVQVTWAKAGENALLSHQEESGPVSLDMYGQTVTLLGTVTVLTLGDVRQTDEGNYTVAVNTDIDGVTGTSSTSFYIDVTDNPSTEKSLTSKSETEEDGMSVGCAGGNTAAIVGGVLGGLAGLVVLTVLVVVYCRRSKTKDLPEGSQNRQMSSGGGANGEMPTLPRVADTPRDTAVNIDQNYEPLAQNIARTPRSRDQHYESMTSPPMSGDNTYENTEGAESSVRTQEC